jgi:GAF domain-containing protein/HAMP domain-containing protein
MNNMDRISPTSSRLAAKDGSPTRRIALGIKLPGAVIALMLVALMIYTYLSIRFSQQALRDTLKNELTGETLTQVELIQSKLLVARAVAQQLAAFAESDTIEEAQLIRMLRGTLLRNDDVFGSTIAYEPDQFIKGVTYYSPYFNRLPDGTLVFSDLGTPEYNYFNRDWYTLPKENLSTVISPPYFDYGGGEIWMVTWSAPFFSEAGDFKGVATADIAFSQTQDTVNAIQVGEKGYAFLIDSNGVILGIGANGGEYKTMSDSMVFAAFSGKTKGWIDLVSQMRAGKAGFVEATDPRGEPMLVAFAPIGLDTGWSLALAYSGSELVSSTSRLRNTLVGYTLAVVLFFGILLFVFTRSITEPLRKLRDFANRVAGGEFEAEDRIEIHTRDELEDLGNAFNQMSANLKQAFGTLEEKVEIRTNDLSRLANELRTIAEVTRELSVIRDQSTLLNVSANLIRERLGYYHVGIFLVDDKGEFAILRGASSGAAEQMLARNHKLKVGESGLVGAVTRTGLAYIAQDVDLDSIHLDNPDLPETRSEITLPLRSYNVTIGALDIQSTTRRAFTENDIQTLQILADQLAAAIENSLLVQRLENTLSELSKTTRNQSREVWQSFLGSMGTSGYEYDGLQIRPIPTNLPTDLSDMLHRGSPVVLNSADQESKNILLVPIMIFDQAIGVIGLEQEDPNKTWGEEQIAIAQAAANRAALTLENARLLEVSNRRAAKERAILEATSRIGAAYSTENILHTAAEEIEKVLSGSEIIIQFSDIQDPAVEGDNSHD